MELRMALSCTGPPCWPTVGLPAEAAHLVGWHVPGDSLQWSLHVLFLRHERAACAWCMAESTCTAIPAVKGHKVRTMASVAGSVACL